MSSKKTLKQELDEVEKQIEDLKKRKREIYKASLEAPETEKICEDYIAKMYCCRFRFLRKNIEFYGKMYGVHFVHFLNNIIYYSLNQQINYDHPFFKTFSQRSQ